MKQKLLFPKTLWAFLMLLSSVWGWGQTPFVMANGNYSESFSDIANWGTNFVSGTGANFWSSVAINSSGAIPDGKKTTKSSAIWSTSTAGGLQKGTESMVFLSTGTTPNGEAVAVDLLLDFTGRSAGTISFDWSAISNGTRPTSLRVYWSVNGTDFTEFSTIQILDKVFPNAGSITTIALPSQFNNASTARIRFYNHAGGTSGSGARNKIQIDNILITSTAGNTPTIYSSLPTALDSFAEIFGSSLVDIRTFSTSAENLTADLVVTPPANWEISLSANSGFTTGTISLIPVNNSVAQTTIYVRLANGSSIGTYSGNITLSSTGAATKNIAVSGTVNIATPVAIPATNINNTGFNANWNVVPGATGYIIDVYRLLPTTLFEGFDGGTTPPAGWLFTGLGTYASGGISVPSLRLDDTGDRVLTPLYSNDVKELKFWLTGNSTNSSSPSSLLIEGFNGSTWIIVDNITPISTSATTYVYNSTSSILLPSNLKQFRFTYTKNVGNIAFDDYSIIINQKNFVAGFENKSLTNVQTTLVDSLLPGTEYYYVVRSTNGSVTSANSNIITTITNSSTVWNGTSWSAGSPTNSINVSIEANYSTVSNPAFSANNISIKNNGVLEITSGNTITANNVTVEDGGNLIQRDGGILTLPTTGAFNVQKATASAPLKYVFWSSPVAAQNIFDIYPSGNQPQYVMTYNTATNFYTQIPNAASNFTANAGIGYSVKMPTTAITGVNFGGSAKIPNSGNISVPLSIAGNGFNLIGNPYPSNLSLTDFLTANQANIASTLWFWDNSGGSVTTQTGSTATNNSYATFNAAGTGTWVAAPNSTSANTTPQLNANGPVAKIGQGFIVKALTASNASFTNAMRTATAGNFLNKNVNAEGKYWLKLTTSYGASLVQAITYGQGATDALEAFDSKAMSTGADAFFSSVGTEKLVIQGRAPFMVNDIVPLGTKHFESGSFTIALDAKTGLFANGQAIYLHDKQLNTYTNLQNQNYTFSSAEGEYTNRFEIVYNNGLLATAETVKSDFEIYRENDHFVIRNAKKLDLVEIYDAAGRKIRTMTPGAVSAVIRLEAKGMFIIKAKSGGKEWTKKLTN